MRGFAVLTLSPRMPETTHATNAISIPAIDPARIVTALAQELVRLLYLREMEERRHIAVR